MSEWVPAPFNKLLGVNVLLHSAERTEAEIVVREELLNRRGVMHGGAVMAMADTLGGMTASISLSEPGRHRDHREQNQFLRRHPEGRHRAGRLHPAAPGPHHHRAGDAHHPRRRQARRDRHADAAHLRQEDLRPRSRKSALALRRAVIRPQAAARTDRA